MNCDVFYYVLVYLVWFHICISALCICMLRISFEHQFHCESINAFMTERWERRVGNCWDGGWVVEEVGKERWMRMKGEDGRSRSVVEREGEMRGKNIGG